MHGAEFHRCMVELDADGVMRLWREVAPHLHQPADRAEALVTLHMARTAAPSVPAKLRQYSHAWLCERGLPSRLPVELRPPGERSEPVIADAVGVSVQFSAPELKPVSIAVQGAMSDAVMDAYSVGRREPEFVRARMREARAREMKALGLPQKSEE